MAAIWFLASLLLGPIATLLIVVLSPEAAGAPGSSSRTLRPDRGRPLRIAAATILAAALSGA